MKIKFIVLSISIFLIAFVLLLAAYNVLKYTPELNIHRMRGAIGNQIYVSKDGHKESVFNAEGKLVKDPVNMGSYNYCHPFEEPVGHFLKDILPWLKWGNTRDDPTTFKERLSAYYKDLKIGLKLAIKYEL